MGTEPFILFPVEEVEAVRREVVILRQELSDRDETISELKQQIEESEATNKMLKEIVHIIHSTAAGEIKKEAPTKAGQLSLQQDDPGKCVLLT